ncbi:hypothetical protein BDZ91DRAFT_840748 [Kalaharituber pfeilii]|nr:hypothetical protein BDZ91DRAFT_840748 [Kalaharituber pfeilii]
MWDWPQNSSSTSTDNRAMQGRCQMWDGGGGGRGRGEGTNGCAGGVGWPVERRGGEGRGGEGQGEGREGRGRGEGGERGGGWRRRERESESESGGRTERGEGRGERGEGRGEREGKGREGTVQSDWSSRSSSVSWAAYIVGHSLSVGASIPAGDRAEAEKKREERRPENVEAAPPHRQGQLPTAIIQDGVHCTAQPAGGCAISQPNAPNNRGGTDAPLSYRLGTQKSPQLCYTGTRKFGFMVRYEKRARLVLNPEIKTIGQGEWAQINLHMPVPLPP